MNPNVIILLCFLVIGLFLLILRHRHKMGEGFKKLANFFRAWTEKGSYDIQEINRNLDIERKLSNMLSEGITPLSMKDIHWHTKPLEIANQMSHIILQLIRMKTAIPELGVFFQNFWLFDYPNTVNLLTNKVPENERDEPNKKGVDLSNYIKHFFEINKKEEDIGALRALLMMYQQEHPVIVEQFQKSFLGKYLENIHERPLALKVSQTPFKERFAYDLLYNHKKKKINLKRILESTLEDSPERIARWMESGITESLQYGVFPHIMANIFSNLGLIEDESVDLSDLDERGKQVVFYLKQYLETPDTIELFKEWSKVYAIRSSEQKALLRLEKSCIGKKVLALNLADEVKKDTEKPIINEKVRGILGVPEKITEKMGKVPPPRAAVISEKVLYHIKLAINPFPAFMNGSYEKFFGKKEEVDVN